MEPNQSPGRRISHLDIQTGIGLFLTLALVYYVPRIQALAAATGVVMCMQETGRFSVKASLIRLLGVAIAGTCGVLVVLADNAVGVPWMFFLLSGIGVILTLLICKMARMPYITAKVSCITFALVILVARGDGRIAYAINRLIGTAVGAVMSVAVSNAWNLAVGKMRAKHAKPLVTVEEPKQEHASEMSQEPGIQAETGTVEEPPATEAPKALEVPGR